MRRDLPDHQEKVCPKRDYQCEHCGKKGTYAHITQAHDKTCEKKPISCPECQDTMLQGTKRKHLEEECEAAELPCKYIALGCGAKMKRRDKAAHEQDSKTHLQMAIETINKMKQKEESVIVKCLLNNTAVADVNGCRLHVKVSRLGSHLQASVTTEAVETVQGKGSITLTLLNQLEDDNHHSAMLTLTGTTNGQHRYVKKKFMPSSKLNEDPTKNTLYLKYVPYCDNTMYCRVSVKGLVSPTPWLQ